MSQTPLNSFEGQATSDAAVLVPKIASNPLRLFLQWAPFIPIVIYLILAISKISSPGLHYDEILFGNVALGGLDDSFIYVEVFGIPVTVLPYVGALKSYLYFPIFKVVSSSYTSIRLPMILLTGFTLCLVHSLAKNRAGETVALLSLLFLVADASFIALTRTDFGPVVLSLFFRTLMLLCFVRYLDGKRTIFLAGMLLCLSLGLFNKLDFIWFAGSFLVAAMFYSGSLGANAMREFIGSKRNKLFVGICFLLVVFSLREMINLGIFQEIRPTLSHTKLVARNLLQLLDGFGFYEVVFGPSNSNRYLGWSLWTLILSGSVIRWRQPTTPLRTFHLFLLTIMALIVIQIVLTEKAVASWHVFMIYPMSAILLASSLAAMAEFLLPARRSLRSAALAVAALAIWSFQLETHMEHVAAYQRPYQNIAWSRKIDDLIAYTQSVPNKFVSLDWGIHSQLLVMTRQEGKYSEMGFLLRQPLTPEQEENFVRDYMSPEKAYLFILHGEETTAFIPARMQWFALAQRHGLRIDRIHAIAEDGRVLFEIYKLS